MAYIYQSAIQQPGLELGSAYLAFSSKHIKLLMGRPHLTCFSDSIVK